MIANNVIERCFHGLGFSDGAQPMILNNTIVGCNVGVALYAKNDRRPGARAVMINNLLWDNRDLQTGAAQDLVLDGSWWRGYSLLSKGSVDARHNVFGTDVAGNGNMAQDPALEWREGIPVPGAGSLALDTGLATIPNLSVFSEQVIREVLATDFLGQPRPYEDGFTKIDRGAIEVQ